MIEQLINHNDQYFLSTSNVLDNNVYAVSKIRLRYSALKAEHQTQNALNVEENALNMLKRIR